MDDGGLGFWGFRVPLKGSIRVPFEGSTGNAMLRDSGLRRLRLFYDSLKPSAPKLRSRACGRKYPKPSTLNPKP